MPIRATLEPFCEVESSSDLVQSPMAALDVGAWTQCTATIYVTCLPSTPDTVSIEFETAIEASEGGFHAFERSNTGDLVDNVQHLALEQFGRFLRWTVKSTGTWQAGDPLRFAIELFLREPCAGEAVDRPLRRAYEVVGRG